MRACLYMYVYVNVCECPQYAELRFMSSLNPNDYADQSSLRIIIMWHKTFRTFRISHKHIIFVKFYVALCDKKTL